MRRARRFVIGATVCLLLAVVSVWLTRRLAPTVPWPVSPNTTVAVGPLDADGYVDYTAALNDSLSANILPEDNAAAGLWGAIGPVVDRSPVSEEIFRRLGVETPPATGPYYVSLTDYIRLNPALPGGDLNDKLELMLEAGRRPWKPEEMPEIAGWLTANAKPIDAIETAVRRPDYYNPLCTAPGVGGPGTLMHVLLRGNQTCREFAALLTARAMLRAGSGDAAGAWDDVLTCYRLGRQVGRGATLIEKLVGVAIEAVAWKATVALLEHAPPTAEKLAEYRAAIRHLPPAPRMADALNGAERFMVLDTIQFVRKYGPSRLEKIDVARKVEPNASEVRAMRALDWAPTLRRINTAFDRLAAADLSDPDQREEQFRLVEAEFESMLEGTNADWVGGTVAINLSTSVRKVSAVFDRAARRRHLEEIVFGLAAFKAKAGHYPDRLTSLVPEYVAGSAVDVEALAYERAEGGYVLSAKEDGVAPGTGRPDLLTVRMPK